jgi:nucleoside-diphosphate-sugar epimerase
MKALVTGGGGFLGGAVVRLLRARGDEVASFSRGEYPELQVLGVHQYRGDLTDLAALTAAVQSRDVVFHVAARPGIWGPFDEYYRANVLGTENILTACRQAGVGKLIYTSSPSVVFNGRDQEGIDESTPYPTHFHAPYPHTKALAEQKVLAANGPDLATVSLRPHLIWGPGDNHLVPRLIARARSGQLRRVGNRSCLVDTTYIDNAASAHLAAADRLAPGAAPAGRAYFISNGEPMPLWDLVNRILAAADLPPVTRCVPAPVAYAAGAVLEGVYSLFRLRGEPRMTRFVARELSTAHWFDLTAARRDLGYVSRVSIDEGLRRLADALKQTRRAGDESPPSLA